MSVSSASDSSTSPMSVISADEIEKVRSIGSGVYGAVYLCKIRGYYCAVKTLKKRSKPRNMKAFLREMEIMQKLFHPNICLYMGACTDPPMIVTEYVERGDLHQLLQSSEPLSICLRVKMATDAATGMSWLHEMKPDRVLHRDLKCLARDTAVLMYDGSVKVVQEVRPGDCVMGDDATPRRVLQVVHGRQRMVRVSSARNVVRNPGVASSSTSSSTTTTAASSRRSCMDSSSSRRRARRPRAPASAAPFVCNLAHVLSLKLPRYPTLVSNNAPSVASLHCLVAQRAPDGTVARLRLRVCRVPRRAALRHFDAPATPATLAARKRRLRTLLRVPLAHDEEPVARDEPVDIAAARLLDDTAVPPALRAHCVSYFAAPLTFGGRVTLPLAPTQAYTLGWHNAKLEYVPDDVKFGSIEARQALLAGVLDSSCGAASERTVARIEHASDAFLCDLAFVAQSLALHVTPRLSCCAVEVRGQLSQLPCRVRRRLVDDLSVLHEPLQLTLLPEDAFFGFSLNGNQRFVLADSFKVTHNSKNLLVNKLYRVKVADFGLSQLLPDGMAGQDSNAMRGTPLWNAPEVLNRQVFTEKCDIYSFAICLAELLTRRAPFQTYGISSLAQLIEVVCEREERPRLPGGTPDALVNLLDACWHPNPAQRPPFRKIVPVLEKLIVHSAVTDDYAAQLWIDAFGAADPIPWSKFLPAFLLHLQLTPDMVTALCDETLQAHRQLPATARITVQCLRRYLCGPVLSSGSGGHVRTDAKHAEDSNVSVDASASDVVWLERYGASMDVFRPLPGERPNAAALLDEFASLCATGWFHGHVTRQTVQERLQTAPPGTFLVRCSASLGVGHWAISFVRSGANGENTIAHRRIRHTAEGFSLEMSSMSVPPPGLMEEDSASQSTRVSTEHHVGTHTLLFSLIQAAAKELDLQFPADGSSFAQLFSQPSAVADTGYDEY